MSIVWSPESSPSLHCLAVLTLALSALGAESAVDNSEELARIERAVPRKAIVQPAKPRRLLIFTLNVGYGGHRSIAYANEAFALMGRRTGAFDVTVSGDPALFQNERLRQFDAVFFNNTVGNCFTNATLRRNLLEFLTGGGGLLGVHGTSVAFTRWPGAIEDWPEFGRIIGARGASHKESNEHVWIKLDDPDHPLNRVFGGNGFGYRDEFFRVHDPYSRERVRVLFGIDTARTDLNQGPPRPDCLRADNDYALAWVRNYGRGRVCYCTIAHNPYVFWDPKMLQFYLAAAQFVVGDLPAPTIPSGKLTPAIRAQEKLGWRLGAEACSPVKFTLFETIDKTRSLNLPFIGASSFQKVSKDISKHFDPDLTDTELEQVRLKLDDAGLRLLTYHIPDLPKDEAACRKVFEFGRKMGVETFISRPGIEVLDRIGGFCDEYGINVALHNRDGETSPEYWHPEGILKLCAGCSKRLGACGDVDTWIRSGIDPVRAAGILKERLITVHLHDLDAKGTTGREVPWGHGVGQTAAFIKELRRLGLKPTMFGLEYTDSSSDSPHGLGQSVEFFNHTILELTR